MSVANIVRLSKTKNDLKSARARSGRDDTDVERDDADAACGVYGRRDDFVAGLQAHVRLGGAVRSRPASAGFGGAASAPRTA
jgi:hypothetical protein